MQDFESKKIRVEKKSEKILCGLKLDNWPSRLPEAASSDMGIRSC